MKYLIFGLALCGVALGSGCSFPMPGPEVQKLPKWQQPEPVERYGDWVLEPRDCSLRAASAEVKAGSTGIVQNGLLGVRLDFLMPLVRPPVVSLSGIPVPLPLDGSGWTFRTYLAYDAKMIAHMMEPGTFIVVSYQPLNTTQVREVHFDTRGLLLATAHLKKGCK